MPWISTNLRLTDSARKSSITSDIFFGLPITLDANRIHHHVTECGFICLCAHQCPGGCSLRGDDPGPVCEAQARGAVVLDTGAADGLYCHAGLYFDGGQCTHEPDGHLLFSPLLYAGRGSDSGLAGPGQPGPGAQQTRGAYLLLFALWGKSAGGGEHFGGADQSGGAEQDSGYTRYGSAGTGTLAGDADYPEYAGCGLPGRRGNLFGLETPAPPDQRGRLYSWQSSVGQHTDPGGRALQCRRWHTCPRLRPEQQFLADYGAGLDHLLPGRPAHRQTQSKIPGS